MPKEILACPNWDWDALLLVYLHDPPNKQQPELS